MARPKRQIGYLGIGIALLLAVVGLSACGSSSSSSSSTTETSESSEGSGGSTTASETSSGEKYNITLDINGTFNSWRTQMQHTVEFAAENEPLGPKVNFKFVASPESLSGQANDLNNIIAEKPDAILLDAASATGLNAQVTKACAAGIIVVSFDNVVTSPCAYKITTNIKEEGELVATHIAEQLNEEGEVIVDRAFPGAAIADELYSGYTNVIKKFPKMKIAASIESKWVPGTLKSQVGSVLAAHPNVAAVLFDIYIEPVLAAFEEAGLPPAKIGTGTITNGDVAACEKAKAECTSSTNPPLLGAEALKLAVELLEGKAAESENEVFIKTPFLFTNPVPSVPGFEGAKIEQAEHDPSISKEAVFPIAPEWLDITPEQATGASA